MFEVQCERELLWMKLQCRIHSETSLLATSFMHINIYSSWISISRSAFRSKHFARIAQQTNEMKRLSLMIRKYIIIIADVHIRVAWKHENKIPFSNNGSHSILIFFNRFPSWIHPFAPRIAMPPPVLTIKFNVRKEFSQPQSNFHKKKMWSKVEGISVFGPHFFAHFKREKRRNERRMRNLWFYYLFFQPFLLCFHVQ